MKDEAGAHDHSKELTILDHAADDAAADDHPNAVADDFADAADSTHRSHARRGRGPTWSPDEEALLQRLFVQHKGDWDQVTHNTHQTHIRRDTQTHTETHTTSSSAIQSKGIGKPVIHFSSCQTVIVFV